MAGWQGLTGHARFYYTDALNYISLSLSCGSLDYLFDPMHRHRYIASVGNTETGEEVGMRHSPSLGRLFAVENCSRICTCTYTYIYV